jgi:ABC-2 type transport system permease protein
MVPFRQIPASFISLVVDLGVLGLGLAAYGALFTLVGTALRRPLLAGLVFVFGWELVTLVIPGYLKRFTLAYYLQPLVPHAMPTGDTVSLLQGAMFREPPSIAVSIGVLVLATVVSLAIAVRVVEQREYVLEQ